MGRARESVPHGTAKDLRDRLSSRSVSAPEWLQSRLGWKSATKKSEETCKKLFGKPKAPNLADLGSTGSLRIAGAVYEALEIDWETDTTLADDESSGAALERDVEADMKNALPDLDKDRGWHVSRSGIAADYAQFQHLSELQRLFKENPALRSTLASDYHVKTDVCVGVQHPLDSEAPPFLHAAISCKWTIRSDRVQNVRYEFATLVRTRRGRLPHLVLVTAEPLPSRLISIARGTGEVDAVYHLLFDELTAVIPDAAAKAQRADWEELVGQQRLLPYAQLAENLTLS